MINVAIIEDNQDFRNGLSFLLNATEGIKNSHTFVNAESGISGLSEHEDLLLLDVNLPGISGIEALPIIKAQFPKLKILILTIFDDDDTIINAILNGADGYILKKSPPSTILTSIKECLEGGSPMTASIASRVLSIFKQHIPKTNDSFSLTPREIEILQLLVDGQDNHIISDKLCISIQTVRNHIRHIYKKLHVHSKTQAVVKAIREGLV